MKYDLIIFVEDPGAANFIVDLYKNLIENKYNVLIIADGPCKLILKNNNVKYTNYSQKTKIHLYSKNISNTYLVGTSERADCEGLKVIRHCKINNITSLSFIDMSINLDTRYKGLSNNPLKYVSDYIFVIDESAKSTYMNFGFDKNKIIVVNHPVVERLSKYVHSKNENKNSIKKIVFIDEGVDMLNRYNTIKNKNYYYNGTSNSVNRTKIIFEELLLALKSININYKLVVRLHPNNKEYFYSEYDKYIDQFSHNTNPYPLIASADIVVGMTSMLLYETSFINKNHFSIIAQNIEKDWLPSIIEMRTRVATKRSEIIHLLNLCHTGLMELKSRNKLLEQKNDFSRSLIELLNKFILPSSQKKTQKKLRL